MFPAVAFRRYFKGLQVFQRHLKDLGIAFKDLLIMLFSGLPKVFKGHLKDLLKASKRQFQGLLEVCKRPWKGYYKAVQKSSRGFEEALEMPLKASKRHLTP